MIEALCGVTFLGVGILIDPLGTLMVGIGIPLSFLTLRLWWYLLQGV